ncbi:substrate-binding domain-containing protein [Arthrobacter alpinus]|nr:substrate-binding domain-containing protein [Arthrobacter alpinus]
MGGASASSVAGSYAGGNAGSTTGSTIEATQPTAIIYDDAVMAMGGLAALAELGLAVPDQVSVLAWDDSVQCQLAGVSALSHDVAAYGELAAELLLSHVAQTAQPAGSPL